MAHPAVHILGTGMQVHHLATAMQPLPIVGTQHTSPASGQDTSVGGTQFVQHGLFNIPKRRFALTGEVVSNRAAQAPLDEMVRVHKGQTQPSGEMFSDGGFAGAWEADEGYQFKNKWNKKIARSVAASIQAAIAC